MRAELESALQQGNTVAASAACDLARDLLAPNAPTEPRSLLRWLSVAIQIINRSTSVHEGVRKIQDFWVDRTAGQHEFERHLLLSCRVIAGTCIGFAANRTASELEYDWVIVDEAGRATPPELLVPLVRGRRIVLVGDHRQLPPVVDEDAAKAVMQKFGLQRDTMGTSLFAELFEGVCNEARSRLIRQYRMHPELGSLIGSCFYADVGLENGIDDSRRQLGIQMLGAVIRWIDTTGHAKASEHRVETSFRNYLEATVIVKEIDRMARKRPEGRRVLVGVLTAYSPQAELLQRRIQTERKGTWDGLDIQVLTVDAAQGKEFDVVLYSAVRSNPNREIGFLRDERRLNVALSRAREALIIVGDSSSLATAHARYGANPFGPVLAYFHKEPKRRPIQKLAPVEA